MRTELNPLVTIAGTGAYLGQEIVDNDTLAKRVTGYDAEKSGDFGEWVDQVTHVHERRFCSHETRTSDLALKAAQQALDTAGIEAKDLGLIIYASFTVSQDLPGDHCMMAEDLGAHDVPVFHLKAACAGSVYGMGLAYGMIVSGVYEHVLVVGAETASKALNFNDPITSIIFGDGSGALVMSRSDDGMGGGMLPPKLGFQYSARNIQLANSNIPVDVARFPDRASQAGVQLVEQALVEMDSGPNVLRSAINAMASELTTCLGYERRDIRRGEPGLIDTLKKAIVIPHQANGRIIDGLCDKLRMEPDMMIRTIYRYGNISAASNLIALDYALRHGNMSRTLDDEGRVVTVNEGVGRRVEEGDLILMTAIGGGYLMGCTGFVASKALVAATEESMAVATAM